MSRDLNRALEKRRAKLERYYRFQGNPDDCPFNDDHVREEIATLRRVVGELERGEHRRMCGYRWVRYRTGATHCCVLEEGHHDEHSGPEL